MDAIDLIRYNATEINLRNAMSVPHKIEVTQQIRHNVSMHGDMCGCKTTLVVTDKDNPTAFGVEMTIFSEFKILEQIDEKDLNAETFRLIFPYIRIMVSTLTSTAGMPPLLVKYVPIDPDTVQTNSNKDQAFGN